MDRINRMIDHTLLKADAKEEEIRSLCKEAIDNDFIAICVNPDYINLSREILKDSRVKIATVIGFPLGADTKEVKAFATKDAIDKGASEIDMVINIAALKNKNYIKVKEDIEAVVQATNNKAIVKVIIETALLTREEKIQACKLAMKAGADFVKTSTGFSSSGASIEDVKLMKSIVGDRLQVKASGGIRDRKTGEEMIKAGASRLGTSSGIDIIKNKK